MILIMIYLLCIKIKLKRLIYPTFIPRKKERKKHDNNNKITAFKIIVCLLRVNFETAGLILKGFSLADNLCN